MNQRDELKDRVEAKRKELEARISELKADSRSASREEAERLRSELDELSRSLKDGWDQVTEAGAKKLNDWLKRH